MIRLGTRDGLSTVIVGGGEGVSNTVGFDTGLWWFGGSHPVLVGSTLGDRGFESEVRKHWLVWTTFLEGRREGDDVGGDSTVEVGPGTTTPDFENPYTR